MGRYSILYIYIYGVVGEESFPNSVCVLNREEAETEIKGRK